MIDRTIRCLLWGLITFLPPAAKAGGIETALQSPGFPPSRVDEQGTIHEDWGQVGLRVTRPTNVRVTGQAVTDQPFPHVVTRAGGDSLAFEQQMYRAPIWPGGADVIEATIQNLASSSPLSVTLELLLPAEVAVGEELAVLGARPVIALPPGLKPVRRERDWGCTGGVAVLPGWARPLGACDPGFANIRAGMGGVPIVYRFSVPSGAERTVVLGLCESHWTAPGQRPVELYVEGAPKREIDPIARWGRHQPGCLRFAARDANRDGRLQVVVAPHPEASDKNTILNVIWVFAPDVYIGDREEADVLLGSLNAVTEYYVDVGGERDQLLYEGGTVRYGLTLDPREERQLLFLVASPGCPAVPSLSGSAWTPATLRRAATEVWSAWPPAGGDAP